MNCAMAARVEQNSVFIFVRSTVYLVEKMVVVPSCLRRYCLLADWADSVLCLPETKDLGFGFQDLGHDSTSTEIEVGFPCWVEWVGCRPDEDMTLNGYFANVE